LGKCLIRYQLFVLTINKQGNNKTDLAEASDPIWTI